ncbi:MAG TPA: hypothetical protein VF920_07620 [Dongiaceae bacterium]
MRARHDAWLMSPTPIAGPERLFRQMRRAGRVLAIVVFFSIAFSVLNAVSYGRAHFHFGDGTQALAPEAPHLAAKRVASFVLLLIHLSGVIGFFVAMTKARRLAETMISRTAFRWSWGWTIWSCFIPILNLLRPWLGFGELRYLVLAPQSEPDAVRARSPRYFSPATCLLWFSTLLFCLDRFLLTVVSAGLSAAIKEGGDIDAHYKSLMHLFSLDAIVIGLVGWQAYAFQRRLRFGLEQRFRAKALHTAALTAASS